MGLKYISMGILLNSIFLFNLVGFVGDELGFFSFILDLLDWF